MKWIAVPLVWAATVAWTAAVENGDLWIPPAAEYSASCGEISLLVWQGGRVLYGRGESRLAPASRVFSITKSLVAVGVFRDIKRGGVSLDQVVRHPAARGGSLAGLMNQASGLSPARGEFYTIGLKDKEAVLKRLRGGGEGGQFVYGPSHWEVLADEIRLRPRGTVSSWLKQNVPGAGREILARWLKDDGGMFFFSTGARMNAAELLPAGREVLEGLGGGRWPEEVRSFFKRGSQANPMYALGFWLNREAGPGADEVEVESVIGRDRPPSFWREGCLSRAAPRDLVAMVGTRGQRVYVVPSQELVVIRLGAGRGFSDAVFLRRLFDG